LPPRLRRGRHGRDRLPEEPLARDFSRRRRSGAALPKHAQVRPGRGVRLLPRPARQRSHHQGWEVGDAHRVRGLREPEGPELLAVILYTLGTPYTHTGALASYQFTQWFGATVGSTNGWDNSDNNNGYLRPIG